MNTSIFHQVQWDVEVLRIPQISPDQEDSNHIGNDTAFGKDRVMVSSAGRNGQKSWVTRAVSSVSESKINQNLLEMIHMVKIRQKKTD